MDNNLIARGNDNQAARSLDDEWRLMNKALAKIEDWVGKNLR